MLEDLPRDLLDRLALGLGPDGGKVRVLVDIFGRETPVELNFEQIQKF